jgi:betaine lipid synthase
MLGLVAAQLKYRTQAGLIPKKPVWVDVSIETPRVIEGVI